MSLKQQKEQLEETILKLIVSFEQENDCKIKRVKLNDVNTVSFPIRPRFIRRIKLKIKL